MAAPLRVLLLDDNPDDRALTARKLEREFPGIEVKVVVSQNGLNQALEDGGFDAVITESHLRWTSGLSILHAVKACSLDCPVIMFTGSGSEEVAVEAMKSGLSDYVVKSPHHFLRLAAAVRLAREQGRRRREAHEDRARYRDLFEGMPIGLYLMSRDRRFLDVNPEMVEILGYPDRASLLQAEVSRIFPDDGEEERLWQSLQRRDGVVRGFETEARRRDGSSIRVRRNASTVRGMAGRMEYYQFSVEEVAARAGVRSAATIESTSDRAPPPHPGREG